ncbi:type I methionyl aminopeptidase [Candidatus Parcubacteria bacterium]|nr:type I methionyl aminopeptidase [Candidatus Parcubacteria bacterium]
MITKKTKEEIAILREGGRRLAAILEKVAYMVRPGVSTAALNDLAEKLVKEGGDTPAFLHYKPEGARRAYPASLCVSVNDEIVHGIPNEGSKILEEGDIVSLDLGLVHKNLITDSAITVAVGSISEVSKKLLEATKRALASGISEATVGHHIGDIGAAVQKVAKEYGFTIADNLAGHGVGYKVHEEPYVPNTGKKGNGKKLTSGMVIAIEPMLTTGGSKIKLDSDGYTYKTLDGSRSAHFEHTVAISENGPIILTDN